MTLLDNSELSWTIYVLRSAGLIFAVIATVNSFVLIWSHVTQNRHAALRAYTIRILLMVPVYSIAACAVLWGSGVVPIIRQVLSFVRELYESVVIFSFLQFVLACASGPDALASRFSKPEKAQTQEPGWGCLRWKRTEGSPCKDMGPSFAQRTAGGKETNPEAAGRVENLKAEIADESATSVCSKPQAQEPSATATAPASAAPLGATLQVSSGSCHSSHGRRELVHLPLFRRCLPPWSSARQMLRFCVIGTLSYVVVGGALAIVGLVLLLVQAVAGGDDLTGYVTGTIWEFSSIGLSLSQAIAILSLAELAVNLKEELAPLRPYGKFLSVKMVVFFTFWQGMMLRGLITCNAFDFLVRDEDEEILVKEVINNFLICFEMMVASWYHYRVFPSHDYLTVLAQLRHSGTDLESPASLGRPITTSDVVDIRDIYYTAVQIHRSRSTSLAQSESSGAVAEASAARSSSDPHPAGAVASRRLPDVMPMPRIPSESACEEADAKAARP